MRARIQEFVSLVWPIVEPLTPVLIFLVVFNLSVYVLRFLLTISSRVKMATDFTEEFNPLSFSVDDDLPKVEYEPVISWRFVLVVSVLVGLVGVIVYFLFAWGNYGWPF